MKSGIQGGTLVKIPKLTTLVATLMYIKEDRAKVTLGNLIKIPPNLLLDLSPITFGRIKMFSKFIFLCLQNMVSGQQVEYINLPRPSHPRDLHIGQDLK